MTAVHPTSNYLLIKIIIGFICYCLFSPSWAGSLSWDSLSNQEKTILKSYQTQWLNLTTDKQSSLKRWASLPSEQREHIRSQYSQWKELSPDYRMMLRMKLEHYRSLPPEKREKMKKWRDWMKTLPLSEQNKLHNQWPSLSGLERKQYINELAKKYGRPSL